MTFPLTPPTVLPLLVCSGDPRGTQKSPGTGDHSDEACQSAKEDGAGVRVHPLSLPNNFILTYHRQ